MIIIIIIMQKNRDKNILENYIYNLRYENNLHKKNITLIFNNYLYFEKN
jgi:hypothetical protein